MSSRALAAIVVIAASVMAIYGLAGASRLSGPVILEFNDAHGIHRDDVLIAASWLACAWVAAALWRK